VLEATPVLTLEELREKLAQQGVFVSYGALWRFLDRHKITRKKKTAHASEQDRPHIVKRREDWFEGQLDLDPQRLVFIDETWASTNMARRYGRAPRGQRLRMSVPHRHWKTTTFVAALRLTGMTRPWFSTDRSMAWRFRPMSISSSSRNSSPEMSSSWTTSDRTRA
jgi:hypothetical protein